MQVQRREVSPPLVRTVPVVALRYWRSITKGGPQCDIPRDVFFCSEGNSLSWHNGGSHYDGFGVRMARGRIRAVGKAAVASASGHGDMYANQKNQSR